MEVALSDLVVGEVRGLADRSDPPGAQLVRDGGLVQPRTPEHPHLPRQRLPFPT